MILDILFSIIDYFAYIIFTLRACTVEICTEITVYDAVHERRNLMFSKLYILLVGIQNRHSKQ